MIDLVDCDVEAIFSANGPASLSEERRLNESLNGSPAPSTPVLKVPETAVIKKKADKTETEQFYLTVSSFAVVTDCSFRGERIVLFAEISRVYFEQQSHDKVTGQAKVAAKCPW